MENHKIRTFIVDSFTDTAFKGNPAGVCIIGSQLSDKLMLQIAQELNLSETAFLSSWVKNIGEFSHKKAQKAQN